jgi:hypothetical protein
MGIASTKPFLDLLTELRDDTEHLPVAAHALPELGVEERIELIERIVAFLGEILLPHAAAEERVLYPRAALLLAKRDESPSVALDEAALRRRVAQFAAADPDDVSRLQELLYATHALLSAHLWREEQIYLELISCDLVDEVERLLGDVAGSPALG